MSLTGVTGSELVVDDALRDYLAALTTDAGDTPVAVGFGVRAAAQVRALAPLVDGVVVGSALVRAAERGPARLRALVGKLAEATRRI